MKNQLATLAAAAITTATVVSVAAMTSIIVSIAAILARYAIEIW